MPNKNVKTHPVSRQQKPDRFIVGMIIDSTKKNAWFIRHFFVDLTLSPATFLTLHINKKALTQIV